MATRFPGDLDRDPNELPDNIADSDTLNSPNHATIHNNVNGAVLQIEEKLGTGDTTPSSGAVLIGTGTGTSAWDTTPTFVGDVTIPEGDLILGSTAVTSTAAEINLLDGVTGGTVTASKAVVVDASKDIASFRNVTLTGELDAATLDLSSSADIAGDLVLSGGADGALQFTNAGENSIKIPDNQASALIIEEADNAYITFTTTDSSEAITGAKATTFSSTVNIDGNVDVDANTQLDGTLTVGVNDTGHDVKFFGATDGKYMEWDESADALIVSGTIQASDGSAGAPSITFSGDQDTGVYLADTNRIGFATSGSLKAAISSSGYFFVGTTGGSDFPSTDGFFSVKTSNLAAAFYRTTSTSGDDVVYVLSNVSSTGTKHFQIEADGDVDNTNNSYGSLSDERLKENIVDARDYYEDLRKLEVKNFNFCKAIKVDYDENDAGEIDESTKKVSLVDTTVESRKKLLGLIAQPTEQVMAGLVKTDSEGYKHIRYSVLVPMLLQMCQKLADKVEALEG